MLALAYYSGTLSAVCSRFLSKPNNDENIFSSLQIKDGRVLKSIIDNIDCIIDGPFKIEQRDITLPMRGSRNQKVYYAPFDLWEKI